MWVKLRRVGMPPHLLNRNLAHCPWKRAEGRGGSSQFRGKIARSISQLQRRMLQLAVVVLVSWCDEWSDASGEVKMTWNYAKRSPGVRLTWGDCWNLLFFLNWGQIAHGPRAATSPHSVSALCATLFAVKPTTSIETSESFFLGARCSTSLYRKSNDLTCYMIRTW